MRTRRSLLAHGCQVAAVGGLLGVAGCVDRSASRNGARPGGSTSTPTPTATPTATSDAGDRPHFGGYLDDANLFDGSVADRTGRETLTVRVGAGDRGFAFDPVAVAVDPGTTVRWAWTGDGGGHNVVAADGAFDSGAPVGEADATFAYTVADPGTYRYHCEPHEAIGMKGIVSVVDGA